MRITSEDIQTVISNQRRQRNAQEAHRIASAVRRFNASACDCGTPAGYHTSDCKGH